MEFKWIDDNYELGDYKARIKLLELIRGEEAWQIIEEENMFNDPPEEGTEYILVKIQFEYIKGPSAHTAYDISGYIFDIISETGLEYDNPILVIPEPDFSATLYPGGSHIGWEAFQVAIDDIKPLMVFERKSDGTGGIWFRLY